ncbi:hypothetical protein PROFUN_06053 [Planoprotostelium fungivorum]|uniref:Potassium channel tetramerisation-type BTB domain-containing protein n=1 Tax=Planoprotostelium fungivorum TaxID=1890364 RepID=A0A2P6NPP3_9EUKA|nr:hypothetical protein PROFUN_06053 [Planoprotostelium fungivorum]
MSLHVISLRDSDNFFRSASSDTLSTLGRVVIIFHHNGEHTLYNTDWGTIMKDTSSLMTFHVDEHSRMLIERPPRSFPLILSYLETGHLDTTALTEQQKMILMEDVEFFGMRRLEKMLSERSEFYSVKARLSQ